MTDEADRTSVTLDRRESADRRGEERRATERRLADRRREGRAFEGPERRSGEDRRESDRRSADRRRGPRRVEVPEPVFVSEEEFLSVVEPPISYVGRLAQALLLIGLCWLLAGL